MDPLLSPSHHFEISTADEYLAELTTALAGADAASGMLKTALLSNDTHPAPNFANATTALAGGTLNASTVGFVAVGNPLGWARREITRILLVDTPLPLGTAINVMDLRRQHTSIPSQMVCFGGRAFPRGDVFSIIWHYLLGF